MPITETSSDTRVGEVLGCPRCGAAIRVTSPWMAQLKSCPRCMAYARVTVRLRAFAATATPGGPPRTYRDVIGRERRRHSSPAAYHRAHSGLGAS
jgi:hypothetical protein